MEQSPLVSILCATYNQKDFIAQTIEGFLMQKVSFPIEIIIHDDASTDGTAEIVKEYAAKHPDIIKPILQTENQHSKRNPIWKNFIYPAAKGKYYADCLENFVISKFVQMEDLINNLWQNNLFFKK